MRLEKTMYGGLVSWAPGAYAIQLAKLPKTSRVRC
jgi:hypothetical protein